MIDHTGVVVTDMARSKAFYSAALAPLGYALLMDFGDAAGFGIEPKPDFWLGQGSPGEPKSHVAFRADSRRTSTRFIVPRSARAHVTTARPACARITIRTTTAPSCWTPTVTTSKPCAIRRVEYGVSTGSDPVLTPY